MSALDIIILIAVIVVVGLIVFFALFKNRKNPCRFCPYAQSCNKDKRESCYR
ncbi:FeoB-associated Cys-rich membrane protein [bacterium]|jgi:hypothetical protein|nr:FeoB-associated Cys-rich membrane protein [bacterium]